MAQTLAARGRELAPPAWQAAARGAAPLVIGVGLSLALHFLLAPRIGPFYAKVLMDVGINVVLAVSLNIVNGYTGQFSLGHAGFMAVGGYAAGALTYYLSYRLWGVPGMHGGFLGGGDALYVASLLTGGLLAAGAGYLVGLPSMRLRGDYLAIVTLGFGEILRVLLQRSGDVVADADKVRATSLPELFTRLGGAVGFSGLPYYTSLFWVYVFVTLTLVVAYRLKASTQGRAMLSIRENEIAAAAVGVAVTRYKVRAFVVAAFFAGIAGGLYAHEVGTTLRAGELGFQRSVDVVIMVVLGGMGSISGAALAAVLLTVLPEWLRAPTHVWPLGLAALAVLLLARRGRPSKGTLLVAGLTLGFEVLRAVALRFGVELASYRMILYALALILVMILRPQGIFGVNELWDYAPRRWRRPRGDGGAGGVGPAGSPHAEAAA